MSVNAPCRSPHRWREFLGASLLLVTGCRRTPPAPAPQPAPQVDAALVAMNDVRVPSGTTTVDRWRKASLPILDMHTHLDPDATATILNVMDARNMQIVINLSGGSPGHGLEESLAQQQRSHNRIIPFCNLAWRQASLPTFVDDSIALLEQCHALGIKGLKIPKVLGLGAGDLDHTRLKVDAPRLDPIFEACGRLHMVVLIHSGDPKAFFDPLNAQNERYEELSIHRGWSFYGEGFPTFNEIITEFENRVLRHPGTIFIGAHFGNLAEDPARVDALLTKAPNYYIDTAARIPEFGRHARDVMRAFFNKWQDRIVYGSDLGLSDTLDDWMLGSTGAEPPTIADVDQFFSATWKYYESNEPSINGPTPVQGRWKIFPVGLDPAVLAKIYGRNAARLLSLVWPPPAQ